MLSTYGWYSKSWCKIYEDALSNLHKSHLKYIWEMLQTSFLGTFHRGLLWEKFRGTFTWGDGGRRSWNQTQYRRSFYVGSLQWRRASALCVQHRAIWQRAETDQKEIGISIQSIPISLESSMFQLWASKLGPSSFIDDRYQSCVLRVRVCVYVCSCVTFSIMLDQRMVNFFMGQHK